MANLTLIFTPEAIQQLMDFKPHKIVVRSILEEAILEDGKKAGVLRVFADAMQKGNPTPLGTVTGCPNPPCSIDDGD